MTPTGAEIVVRALEDEGIALAFGIPGTHNIELYDALAVSERVRPVLVTDEQSASFMADGAWRASGRMACVNVVPGAGLTHALSGIAEAFMDNVPMLVLGCGIRRDTGRRFQLHDVDQLAIVRPVVKAAFHPETGEELYPMVRRACALARAGAPGPVMVEVPANLYLFRHAVDLDAARAAWGARGARGAPPEHHDASGAAEAHHPSLAPTPAASPAPAADPTLAHDVERAARLLAGARRPLLYLGLGAAAAGPDLVRLAERLEAPVATTFQGKGVFPESHPLFLWPGFGDAAPPFARKIAGECDATLAIGCKFGEVGTGSYGISPPHPLIHVDIDPSVIGRNYTAEVAVEGDAATVVCALLDALGAPRSGDPALRARIREGHAAVRREWSREQSDERVTPALLLAALQRRFGPDAVFTTDSGNGTFLAMEMLRLDAPGRFLAPVDYSCMGYAVPAAIGARLACPDTPVVALAGDGAFLMTGLELLTAAAQGAPVAVLVLRDRELAQIAQFQDVALSRKACSVLPDYDLASIARGVGVACLRMERDADVEPVLGEAADALAAGRPIVVDVAIDYARKTWFTQGVVRTNLGRLPWKDRLRFIGRALGRKLVGVAGR